MKLQTVNLSKKKFLIVDDFANYRNMIRNMLREDGIDDVDDAGYAKRALQLISENKYDVILCDYNLGQGQDGQQLLEEARFKELIGYSTIFIMLTAESSLEMVMGAVEYRPDDYLTKPFPKEVLWKRIQRALIKKDSMMKICKATDTKSYKSALKLCDQELANKSRFSVDIARLKSDICLKINKPQIAEKIYNKMLSIHNFNWATLGLAKVHFINENYDESKTLLEQLIDHHKSYVEAYDILSDIMRLQGDRLEAQEILVTATKLSPKTILRQKKLGELALQQNDIEIAEKAYKAAITFGQYSYLTSASDHAGYAKVLHARKISTKALEILKEAQKNYREDFDGLLHTEIIEALIYKEQGKHNQSQDIFKTVKSEYLQRHNNLPDILLVDLANTCVKFGEKKMVRKIINKLQSSIEKDQIDSIQHNLASTPDERSENDYLSLNKAGMGLYLKGRIPQAIEMFEQAAESLPNNSSVNMNTAQAIIRYMQNNGTSETKLDDARHYLNRVKLIDEQNPKYLDLEKLLTELIENK